MELKPTPAGAAGAADTSPTVAAALQPGRGQAAAAAASGSTPTRAPEPAMQPAAVNPFAVEGAGGSLNPFAAEGGSTLLPDFEVCVYS